MSPLYYLVLLKLRLKLWMICFREEPMLIICSNSSFLFKYLTLFEVLNFWFGCTHFSQIRVQRVFSYTKKCQVRWKTFQPWGQVKHFPFCFFSPFFHAFVEGWFREYILFVKGTKHIKLSPNFLQTAEINYPNYNVLITVHIIAKNY